MVHEDYARGLAALRCLPQAACCEGRAEAWLTALFEREARGALGSGLSLAQHLRRLAGFGASEIGVLVAERRGQYQPFATAREVVARKLLWAEPPPDNPHLRRGTTLEPLVRGEFLGLSGATRRPDLARRVEGAVPPWPWMQGTPDDLIVPQGRLGVVDYKPPAAPLRDVSLEYACQLHQIGLLARAVGLSVTFRALVAWNPETWSPEVLPCPHDPALEQELIAAGDHYWNAHVLAGELPPWPTDERLDLALADLPQEAKREIEALATRWLRLDILAKEAHAMGEETRAGLVERCRALGLGQTVASGAVKITPKPTWDREAIEARLPDAQRAAFARPQWDLDTLLQQVRDLGGDPERARIPGGPLELEAAARWLIAERGLPEARLRLTEYRATLSRRQADQPRLQPIRADAGTAVFQFGATP